MKLKKTLLASTTALACTFGAGAHAMTNFADCVSTPVAQFDGNIVEAALATPELSTLVDAVLAAGLDDALANTDNITVYAPTNDAFAAMPADVTGAILADIGLLTTVLTYHVSPGAHDPRRFASPVQRKTLAGEYVYLSRNAGEPRVNTATVQCQGVKADNGLVWIINSVLQPGF
ncbi:MAG: fasciclin domain-containing protein [Halieaceae bacterium]|jgi:uncharacterized surface protein with fasciclin (FAS1) repeats|nr:fasciclin domain-containing protein [Halieaceae bacterium]